MSRLLILMLIAVALAACSIADGPYGYGYAANDRPSLSQLSLAPGDADNGFRTAAPVALAASMPDK